ncbi:MAG: hypothetical protein WDA13_02625 [Candidatus Shapirobacteria bacterium]|jgi:hypothetical protein
MANYHFLLISCITILSYLFSFYLAKTKKIKNTTHCHFWNIILLISFLISGILGLILAFSIDQKVSIGWYLPFLRLHVEFGIVMALVSIFHILWHLPYFICLVKKKL